MKWFLRIFPVLLLFLFGQASLVKACHRCTHPTLKQLPAVKDAVDNHCIKQPVSKFRASHPSKSKYEKLRATEEDEEDEEVSLGAKKHLDKVGSFFATFFNSSRLYVRSIFKNAISNDVSTLYTAIHRFIVLRVIRI